MSDASKERERKALLLALAAMFTAARILGKEDRTIAIENGRRDAQVFAEAHNVDDLLG